jgi:hypothetical protein
MNLLEVQDDLNKLPPIPESIQYLTAAAQGGNPQVPPYMALSRISEMNRQMQLAQNKPQPPAEPLNQSLPKQALQSMGIGALPQGQPVTTGSGAQLQTGSGGQVMSGAAPAPQGMPPAAPPQGMPPQAPPQQAPQTVMAADGGLMGLPVDSRMFEYGSGGIVAFNGKDNDQVVEGDEEGSEDADYDASASMAELAPYIKSALKSQARPISAPSDIEKKLRESKDYGIDEGPIGKGYLEGIAALKEAKAIERARQNADINERDKLASRRALADFSDATRGQTGLGGLTALTRSRIGATEKLMGERTALREDEIKQDSLLNEAKYKMQDLRNAKLKGDIAGEYKAQADLSKIAKDLNVSVNNLISRLAGGNLALMGKEASADASVEAAKQRAKRGGAGGKPPKTTDQERGVNDIAADLQVQHPEWPQTKVRAEATRIYKQMTGAPAVAARERKDINTAWEDHTFTIPYLDTPKAERAAYEREWKRKWRLANPDDAPAAPAPAAGNPKPVLPPGTTTGKFVPGKGTEVLRNGVVIGHAN